jgi:hypothetical protein
MCPRQCTTTVTTFRGIGAVDYKIMFYEDVK